MENELLKTEYSKAFDDKRKALICQSYYKYGKASRNFATGDSFMDFDYEINNCPMCGRKLVD